MTKLLLSVFLLSIISCESGSSSDGGGVTVVSDWGGQSNFYVLNISNYRVSVTCSMNEGTGHSFCKEGEIVPGESLDIGTYGNIGGSGPSASRLFESINIFLVSDDSELPKVKELTESDWVIKSDSKYETKYIYEVTDKDVSVVIGG